MKIRVYFIIFFLPLLVAISCTKIKSLPDEPYIKFTSFSIFDTTDILGNTIKGGRLKFYFEDGDGDLGLAIPDKNQNLDSINMFLTLYRVNNGKTVLAPDNDPFKPSGYRIPYMERIGQNKILKGNIAVIFFYFFCSSEDSIKYDFYVKDRADNSSNIDSTPVLPVFYNGVYEK